MVFALLTDVDNCFGYQPFFFSLPTCQGIHQIIADATFAGLHPPYQHLLLTFNTLWIYHITVIKVFRYLFFLSG
jgi:hypothetical protein